MSRKTPQVMDGFLRDTDGNPIFELGSSGWFAWLREEENRTFRFHHHTGGFTARREYKQRGDCYWVAYRQAQNKLHKTYLGKSDCLTADHLGSAASDLAAQINEFNQQ